ncbi:winged helix-turn-helix transcriptional regulator [Streptomyces gardneri]|uniref:MarR family winged helix-turn-helix transcriptional regulator n=1 Tax=Nocardia TaxID=1817 RepID=UPI001358A9D5|nr:MULTISPECIES: MarR family winged helix-turn-helix transcriptional regulator [Nocardia]MBF6166253.1 winged helix-turn-helix transcriptional regulator [Streptomyces gardneri]MBF6205664.1 winged helix-turn-helix transcriptional regulator [Streptomyces gardneri]
MADVRWLDEREARLWRAYRELTRELQRTFERQLERDAGLSGADYAVLAPVSEAEDGVIRMRELGHEVGWDRSRLSHQVTRMQKRGLVVREDCADDARGAMVRITPAGREAIEAAAPEHVGTVRRHFFDHLSEREQATLTRVFERLLAAQRHDG